ncbi:MAG TPA: condensation domain-containing protein [Pseudonocardiaceae bacterium]|jgi:hypothetical protein|nr:condensation domain-containing protein [Pseudonocardiaceae bacterium]
MTVRVRFDGDGSGVEELTWGQREIWRSIQQRESSMIVGGVVPLPPRTTVSEIATTLRYMMSRHQSLRTRLVIGADGRPRQRLAASGEVELAVVDADGGDPALVAERLRQSYQLTDFDHEHDWPIRMGVVRANRVPTHLVVAYSHLAIDAHGIESLTIDTTTTMDRATGTALSPVTAIQPMDLARQQRTPTTQRQGRASVRYWERLLRGLPLDHPTAEAADPRTPRYWQLGYTSPAAHLAILTIAARTGAHPGPVRLAAFAVALGRVTGERVVAIQTLVHNRFRPGFTGSVSALTQSGLCVLDVGDSTFDEVVGQTWQATTRAGKHAYYDPDELAAMIGRLTEERGTDLNISCYFNDRRRQVPRSLTAPNRAAVLAALPRTTMRWGHRFDSYDRAVMINLNDVSDTLDCMICVDTHRIGPAGLVALAKGIESVVVAAALDPAAPTGVPVPVSSPAGRARS